MDFVALRPVTAEPAVNLGSAAVLVLLPVLKLCLLLHQVLLRSQNHQIQWSLCLRHVQCPVVPRPPRPSQKLDDAARNLEDRPAKEAHMAVAAASTPMLVL
jgi:hypothetical protein